MLNAREAQIRSHYFSLQRLLNCSELPDSVSANVESRSDRKRPASVAAQESKARDLIDVKVNVHLQGRNCVLFVCTDSMCLLVCIADQQVLVVVSLEPSRRGSLAQTEVFAK